MEAAVEQQHEQEVNFDQADEDLSGEPSQQPEQQPDVVETFRPKAEPRVWKLGKDDFTREYIQRPLSFIAKMEWFSLVGSVLDKAMSGDNALSMNSLMSAPSGGRQLTMADFRDADMFIHAIGKLLIHAPTFLVDSYAIWLSVPDYDRPLFRNLMDLPPEDGGLSDEDGMEIIATFIDQNYAAIESFFRERLGELQKRVQARHREAVESRQSRR